MVADGGTARKRASYRGPRETFRRERYQEGDLNIRLVVVPWDSGHVNARMGRGPEHLLRGGLVGALEADGHAVDCRYIGVETAFPTEIATSFALVRELAAEVADCRTAGAFPVVLSGNCGSALGTVAGLGAGTAVVWLDAHGDLNTPETTESGFLDGMALATLLGRCWGVLAGTIPGFVAVPEAYVVHVAGRSLDEAEERALAEGRLGRVTAGDVAERGAEAALSPWLDGLPDDASRFYVHVDLDVLDPAVASVNPFAAPGGLGVEQVETVISAAAARRPLAAAALTSYDPALDEDGRALRAAAGIVRAAAKAAAEGPARSAPPALG